MNTDKIIQLALEANLVNYVDNETPREYYIDANTGLSEVVQFAELIIQEYSKEKTLEVAKKGIKQYREALIDLS